jgi:hypothetical protein
MGHRRLDDFVAIASPFRIVCRERWPTLPRSLVVLDTIYLLQGLETLCIALLHVDLAEAYHDLTRLNSNFGETLRQGRGGAEAIVDEILQERSLHWGFELEDIKLEAPTTIRVVHSPGDRFVPYAAMK